jgi:hypothetical protein
VHVHFTGVIYLVNADQFDDVIHACVSESPKASATKWV